MLKFELSPEQIAILAKALEAQPYGMVAPLIADMQKQIAAQQQPNPLAEPPKIADAA